MPYRNYTLRYVLWKKVMQLAFLPRAGGRQIFNSLQAGRFFAASFVLLFHGYLDARGRKPLGTTFDAGFLGVDFFFVLSGFIILFIHWNDIGKPARVRNFLAKRFIRIYPLYFVATLTIAVLVFSIPNIGLPIFHDPLFVLRNFLMLPTDGEPLLGISWSLQHEAAFYAVFALFIVSPYVGALLFALWFVASAFVGLNTNFPLNWICDPRHLEFLLGMAGAYLLKSTIIPRPRAVLALGLLLFFGVIVICDVFLQYGAHDTSTSMLDRIPLYLPAGLASAVIIVGAVEAERQELIYVPAIFAVLGDISYALYLTHGFVLELYRKATMHFDIKDTSPEMTLGILFLIAVIVAAVTHYYVEKPLMKRLRNAIEPHVANAAPRKVAPL